MAAERLDFDTLRATADGVAEMQDRRPNVFVPRGDVRRIELVRACGAERPWLTGSIGIVLVTGGLVCIAAVLFRAFTGGPTYGLKLAALTGTFSLLGAWLLAFSFIKRPLV